MFSELMPLIQNRPLTLTIAAIDDKQIRVNVIPGKTEKDKAANKEIGFTHTKEVGAHSRQRHHGLDHALKPHRNPG